MAEIWKGIFRADTGCGTQRACAQAHARAGCVLGLAMHSEFPPRPLIHFGGPQKARDLRAGQRVVWAARGNKNHPKRISVAQVMADGRNMVGIFRADTECGTQRACAHAHARAWCVLGPAMHSEFQPRTLIHF